MSTTTRISGVLLVSILLICAAVFSYAALSPESILPTRWDFPAPFESTLTLEDAALVDKLLITLEMSYTGSDNSSIPLSLVSPSSCAIDINDGFQTISTSDVANSIISLDFDTPTTVNNLHILCHGMSVSRSSPYPTIIPNTFPALMEVTVQENSADTHLFHQESIIHILDEPAFHHQYHWAHPESSEIMVTFTFYRPAGCEDTEFTFDDPHLQVPLLTSLALPDRQSDRFDDLAKPFNLLSSLPTICRSNPDADGQAYTADVDFDTSELHISLAPPLDTPFICTFQLTYPPDTLAAIHHHSDPPGWSITYPSRTEGPVKGRVLLQSTIPDRYNADAPPSYYGLHLWVSSYHFFSTQQLTFEFGIATTHQFIDVNSAHKMVKTHEVPHQMTLDITMDGNSFPLSQWNPTMQCTNHVPPLIQNVIDIADYTADIDIASPIFRSFGQKCKLFLTVPNSHASRLLGPFQIRFMPSASSNRIPPQYFFTLFDAFHRIVPSSSSTTHHEVLTLHDSTDAPLDYLPPIQRFNFPSTFTLDKMTGNTIYHLQMNVQYLSHRAHVDSDETRMVLLCVFPQLRDVSELNISPSSLNIALNITLGGYSIFYQDDIQPSVLPISIPTTVDVPDVDNEMNIFKHDRPIRAPYLAIPLPLGLTAHRPLLMTISIPSTSSSIVTTSVYPILLPQHYADALVYSAKYGRITPPRITPLTGYSYRCVKWDQMVAPYVYGEGTGQLTETNSNVCPPFPQDGPPDRTMWKQVVSTLPIGDTRCVYELAAVCVTPSTTIEGAYDVHPLADCPSFLGSLHSQSCGSTPGDEEDWKSNTDDGIEAQLSTPELDENGVYKKRSIHLKWLYAGDPRRTLTIAIKPLLEGRDNDGEDDPQGWITLARDIPAYLPPPSEQQLARPQWQGVTIGFPTLSPKVEAVIVQLTLNEAIGASQSTKIPHTMQGAPEGGYDMGCNLDERKMFDDITQLCRCVDDYVSSRPIGVDHLFVHPLEFDCEPKPSNSNDVPSTSEQCHSIPEHIIPPYRTQRCGYGFSKNTTGKCEDCECFSAWKLGTNDDENDGKKCERCHLKDVCHPTQTAEITFTPEYCLVKRCLCKAGYSGDKCQYTVMYGTLAYHDVATDEQKKNPALIAASKEHPVIVPRRLITTFQPRVTNNVKASLGDTPVEAFVQQATQVLSDDGQNVITSIMVALGRLTNAEVSPSPSPFTMVATSPFTLTAGDGSNSNDLGDLHYAWEQLQNNYQDRPVYKDDEYGTLNGGVGSAYDPHCVPNAFTYCPDGKEDDLLPPESQVDEDELKDVYEQEDPDSPIIDNGDSGSNTTTYIIIGVVLGVVLILFILLIVAILYCRKHEKMCFRQRKTKGSSSKTTSHHASSTAGLELTKASSHSSTPPSAPPSSTMSTSSYLPTQVGANDPTLPADWIALEDKSTGKVYYSNKVTMESTWHHPAQPKEKPKSAYGW